jgi:hypothetical protein
MQEYKKAKDDKLISTQAKVEKFDMLKEISILISNYDNFIKEIEEGKKLKPFPLEILLDKYLRLEGTV